MGKKIAGTKGKHTAGKEKMLDEEASLKKVDYDWGKSSAKAQELEDLRERGLLPPLEEMKTRAPGKDTVPSPRDGERVCFVDFLPRGFGFPIHPFLRGLLYVYGIQIHDLTPNGVLSLASFFVLCECFLGIEPNWWLWKAIFMVKRNVGKGDRQYPVGRFSIQIRDDTTYF